VRVEVELLEDHADLRPEARQVQAWFVDVPSVDDEPAGLDRLQAVDAPDQRALAGAAGAAHHGYLAPGHLEVDVDQHVVGAEPLVDLFESDHGGHRPAATVPSPGVDSLASRRRESDVRGKQMTKYTAAAKR
jgi:hypothetical protein